MAHSRLKETQIYHNEPDDLDEISEAESSFDYKPPKQPLNKKKVSIISAVVIFLISSLIGWWFVTRTLEQDPVITYNELYQGAGTAVEMSDIAVGAPAQQAKKIGLSVGGALDANQFRETIKQGYLPLPSDVGVEGLFGEYFFDTGETEECFALFCPSYSYAVSQDPFSNDVEYYLSVGFNSGIEEQDFSRKKLNTVVVLDISGSMGESFSGARSGQTADQEDKKITIANKALVDLLRSLNPDDRFGLVVFDDQAFVELPLQTVSEMNLNEVSQQILDIEERGGTNIAAGLEEGLDLYQEVPADIEDEYENRIFVITDAQPNVGDTSRGGLTDLVEEGADQEIYATFLGVGLDFNSELVALLSKTRGANYFSVHSNEEFKQQLVDDFEYMVTPLVFDLEMIFESSDFEIVQTYGVPNPEDQSSQLVYIPTLFASRQENEEVKGGLILLKLRKKGSLNQTIQLTARYKDRLGKPGEAQVVAVITDSNPDYFDTNGIRKGVLLARYGELMRQWLDDEHNTEPAGLFGGSTIENPSVIRKEGIGIYQDPGVNWERVVKKLQVSSPYDSLLPQFKRYMQSEIQEIGDESLQQEIELLELITK